VADVAALLAELDADEFVTIGWSGGGPHALACAARLPDSCLAAVSLAGVAPYSSEGLDWMAGMGPENVEEFSLALEGEAALRPWLAQEAKALSHVQGADVAAALGGLVSDVDKAALTGDFAEFTAAIFRRAVSNGVAGWLDDDLAFVRDWGFELSDIKRPVAVWQGDQDRMVPFSHGEWLAQHIPNAKAQLYAGHGHLSIAVGSLEKVIDDVLALASSS
jgi:pimeloyl-ACP methyl ester carboxylesterase